MLLSLELGSGDNQNKPQQKHYCRQHKYCMYVVRKCARGFAERSARTLEIPKRKLLLFLPFLCIRTNLVLPDFTLKYLLNGPFYGDFCCCCTTQTFNHCNILRPATLQWCVNICNAIHQNREDSSVRAQNICSRSLKLSVITKCCYACSVLTINKTKLCRNSALTECQWTW